MVNQGNRYFNIRALGSAKVLRVGKPAIRQVKNLRYGIGASALVGHYPIR